MLTFVQVASNNRQNILDCTSVGLRPVIMGRGGTIASLPGLSVSSFKWLQ